MSRHAIQLGHRALHQSLLQATLLTPSSARPLIAAISTPTSRHLLARCFGTEHTARFPSKALNTFHDAATKNTKPIWPRSPASIASQISFTRGLRTRSPRLAIPQHIAKSRQASWREQTRLLSEEKITEGAKEIEAAAKSGKVTNTSATSSKLAGKTAAGAAGSKTILERLPHIHRPTKYELLATAESFWQRVKINFKWISIRSLRPFTADEIGAFVSWIFLGHIIWIVIGTTTFVSLAIWAANTVFAQETLAGWVGTYLTKSSGLKVVFESAIVPTWRSGVITFNNVFVSRRPGQQADKRERAVKKGSPVSAAAAAAAGAAMTTTGKPGEGAFEQLVDEGNYSQFDVTMETVNVTLSFSKWFNGKGLLRDVEIVGVRGVIDRTGVQPRDYSIDPKSYRHEHDTGDFEIGNFKMSDVLLTVHQPDHFRPFTVSVFNCDLPRLRKQWLFYDFMSANNMSGSFDDSLFTVHPRQVHGTTGAQLVDGVEDDDHQWKKHSRLRIDALNIDHLNRGVEGPFGWIREGNVDIIADVMIPNDDDNIWRQSWRKSTEAMSDLYDKVEATVSNTHAQNKTSNQDEKAPVIDNNNNINSTNRSVFSSTGLRETPTPQSTDSNNRPVIFDIKLHLNDVRASVPLFTKSLNTANNALIRPIVAYINSRRAFIPVTCRVVKRQSEFDGSWTVFDSGLLDDLSREVYAACARDIEDGGVRKRRMRKVGLWTVQLAVQALFIGLAGQLA